MRKVIISSVFMLINFMVFGQMHNNFGGPSTTYQMQQNAQRATQNATFQRQQFDQQQRSIREHQQRDQTRNTGYTNPQPRPERTDRPKREKREKKEKKERKGKKERKAEAPAAKEPVEEKKQ